MPEQILEGRFPVRGIDQSVDVSGQAPLTTPLGQNVRAFEPTTSRSRGGSRPGTLPLSPGQVPSGAHVIQHLNTVVTTDSTNVPLGIEDPQAPTVSDPSSPGSSDLWGTDTLYIDPNTGLPVTGTTLGNRNPSVPGSGGATRRKGGSGYQPNPNQLTQAPPPASPRGCFQGVIEILITKPPPDPELWTGQKPSFFGLGCLAYNPPIVPAPGSATIIPVAQTYTNPSPSSAMPIVEYIKLWLSVNVGSDAFGTVTQDYITDPAVVVSGGCTGTGGNCSAAPPSKVPAVSAVGTIIHAA